MSAVITGIVIGIAILGAGALALRDKAIAQRCEDAISLGCPRCKDAMPEAACTCLGQCGVRDCRPVIQAGIADLYPAEDVEFLRKISQHIDNAQGGHHA